MTIALPRPAGAAPVSFSTTERVAAIEALVSVKRRMWNDARQQARRAGAPLLATAVEWFYLTDSQTDPSFSELRAFIENHPHWPQQNKLRRRAEHAMSHTFSRASTIAWFDRHPPVSATGQILHGAALLKTTRMGAGEALIREAWINGNFDRAEEARLKREFRNVLRQADHEARVERLLWDERGRGARRLLNFISPEQRPLVEARVRLMRDECCVDAGIATVPAAQQNDEGLLYERISWRLRRDRSDALELLAFLPHELRQPDKWWRLRLHLSRQELRDGHYRKAYDVAARHGQSSGLGYAEMEWLSGWIALRGLGDPEAAFRHFTNLFGAVQYPLSRARGAYWIGRAATALGDHPLADHWYRMAARHNTTYYGQLAAIALLRRDLTPPPLVDTLPPQLAEIASFNDDELVKATRLLADLGAADRIDPFIRALYTQAAEHASGGRFQLIADLAASARRPDLALKTAREAHRAGFDLLQYAYPVVTLPDGPHGPGPVPEPALLLAMMRQESGFTVDATSHAGARGMMQIMPATARRAAKHLDVAYSRSRLRTDADYNIALGRAHLSELLEAFDGSYVLSLAAYNAGSSRARSWRRQFGDPRDPAVDPIDWIESIPFEETRNYVQRVIENLQIYRLILKTPAAPTMESDLHMASSDDPGPARSGPASHR